MTTAVATPMSALDRCDRCGAQAYVRVTVADGLELDFCAHHARKYEAVLRGKALGWRDETDRLAP